MEYFTLVLNVSGVPIGSPGFVENWLETKVDEISELVEKTCELLVDDLRAKWTLLLSSIQQKFGYWLSLQYPTDVQRAATRLDSIIWGMFEKAAGLHIPKVDEGLGVECTLDIPVAALRGQSFQALMTRPPSSEHGMGLRSMVDTRVVKAKRLLREKRLKG